MYLFFFIEPQLTNTSNAQFSFNVFFVTSFYLKMIYFQPKIIIIIIIILKIHHLSRETNPKLEVSNFAGSSVCRAPRFDFQLDNFQIFKVKFSFDRKFAVISQGINQVQEGRFLIRTAWFGLFCHRHVGLSIKSFLKFTGVNDFTSEDRVSVIFMRQQR